MSTDVKQALVAGLFGLGGTLLPVFIAWNRERDAVTQRSRLLDEASKRVVFWDHG